VLRCWIFFEQYSHEPHIAVNRHWKLHLLAAEQSRLADRFAQNHTRCEHALSVMEQRLSESPWLAAGRYTIADIALCAHTHMAANRGFDLAPHPNGQSKTAEATVVKQQFDSVWARVAVAAREEPKVCRLVWEFFCQVVFWLLPVPCLERKGRSSSRRLRSGSRSARKGVKGPKC